ncbi:DedA family protein [Arthrobacter sp. GCM10027362]|uniref:DedA family protein n=1 Tax=Arthrobacter sp. GCM10027362 TaxID=3273379 RepID=UPI00362CC919
MQALMDAINVFIVDAAGQWWVYPLLFVLCTVDGFFPPLPSESVVVALAAVAVSAGVPNMWLVVLVAALGAIAGDNIAYAIGRAIGTERFAWMRRPRVAASFAWARRGLEHRGAVLILSARYIPVGRVAVNMTAGATGYSRRRFVPFTLLAGVSWALYSAAVGTLAGQWVSDNHLVAVVLSVAIAMLLGLLVDYLLKLGGRLQRAKLRRQLRARMAANRPAGTGPRPGRELADVRPDAGPDALP